MNEAGNHRPSFFRCGSQRQEVAAEHVPCMHLPHPSTAFRDMGCSSKTKKINSSDWMDLGNGHVRHV